MWWQRLRDRTEVGSHSTEPGDPEVRPGQPIPLLLWTDYGSGPLWHRISDNRASGGISPTATGTTATHSCTGGTDNSKLQWQKDNLSGVTTDYTSTSSARLAGPAVSGASDYTYGYDVTATAPTSNVAEDN